MVHHYPAAVKAFYMARDPERTELALGVDVLAPEGYGEVIGGGERATSLEFLKEQMLCRTAAGSIRVVSRLAPLWQRSSRRFWHGHRTLHRVDVRHRAHSRNDSVSANAVSDATLNVRRFECVTCKTLDLATSDHDSAKHLEFKPHDSTDVTAKNMDERLRLEFNEWAAPVAAPEHGEEGIGLLVNRRSELMDIPDDAPRA